MANSEYLKRILGLGQEEVEEPRDSYPTVPLAVQQEFTDTVQRELAGKPGLLTLQPEALLLIHQTDPESVPIIGRRFSREYYTKIGEYFRLSSSFQYHPDERESSNTNLGFANVGETGSIGKFHDIKSSTPLRATISEAIELKGVRYLGKSSSVPEMDIYLTHNENHPLKKAHLYYHPSYVTLRLVNPVEDNNRHIELVFSHDSKSNTISVSSHGRQLDPMQLLANGTLQLVTGNNVVSLTRNEGGKPTDRITFPVLVNQAAILSTLVTPELLDDPVNAPVSADRRWRDRSLAQAVGIRWDRFKQPEEHN